MDKFKKLIPYRNGNLWGYCDEDGNIVMQPSYQYLSCFNSGFAFYGDVITQEIYGRGSGLIGIGLIDSEFNVVIPYSESKCYLPKGVYSFYELKKVFYYEMIGFFYPQLGQISDNISNPLFELSSEELDGRFDLVLFLKTNLYLGVQTFSNHEKVHIELFDCQGERVGSEFFPKKIDANSARQLHLIRIFHGETIVNGKYGYVNLLGDLLIPFIYDFLSPFKNNYASIKLNSKYSLVKGNGFICFHFIYDEIFYSSEFGIWVLRVGENYSTLVSNDDDTVRLMEWDYPGKMKCKTEKKEYSDYYGLENRSGKELFPIALKEKPLTYMGFSIVKFNHKYGVINSFGEFVLPNKYQELTYLKFGYFLFVDSDENYGVIDTIEESEKYFNFFDPLIEWIFRSIVRHYSAAKYATH
ncbi:WG repeat-containing protein, partial [Algoriphagus aquimarinus]|uniref:WG repeat-containing protein n=1 Tax=Algoriphagus aquimarinus TaxID=237018 RepID=UPI0030D8C97C